MKSVERFGDLPHLLHAEFPHLRVAAMQAETIERDAGEVPLRSLGEHRHLGDDVVAGFEVAQLAPAEIATFVAGAHADNRAVRDQQLRRGRFGQHHGAALFGLLGQPAAEL